MTCVVGIEAEGVVYMGGDSALSDADSGCVRMIEDPKVFVAGCLAVVGCCSSLRVLQALKYGFELPVARSGVDEMTYMVVDFVDAVRSTLQKKGTLKKELGVELHDSHLLVGYRGRLYCVEEDFQVYRVTEPWQAIGSGADLALGSLHSTAGSLQSPCARIRMALEAAAAYNCAVRPPFHVVTLPAPASTRPNKRCQKQRAVRQ